MRYAIGFLSLLYLIGLGSAVWLTVTGQTSAPPNALYILAGMACISVYAIYAGFGKASADRKLRKMREAAGAFR